MNTSSLCSAIMQYVPPTVTVQCWDPDAEVMRSVKCVLPPGTPPAALVRMSKIWQQVWLESEGKKSSNLDTFRANWADVIYVVAVRRHLEDKGIAEWDLQAKVDCFALALHFVRERAQRGPNLEGVPEIPETSQQLQVRRDTITSGMMHLADGGCRYPLRVEESFACSALNQTNIKVAAYGLTMAQFYHHNSRFATVTTLTIPREQRYNPLFKSSWSNPVSPYVTCPALLLCTNLCNVSVFSVTSNEEDVERWLTTFAALRTLNLRIAAPPSERLLVLLQARQATYTCSSGPDPHAYTLSIELPPTMGS